MSGRPTWTPASGNAFVSNARGMASKQYSSRDLPGFTKLKERQQGQNTSEEIKKRDLKKELKNREKKLKSKTDGAEVKDTEAMPIIQPPLIKQENTEEPKEFKVDPNLDADDSDSNSTSSSSGSDKDDAAEEAELMRELEKIKKEREEEQKRKQLIEQEERNKIIMESNPLMTTQDATIKKKWYEETIFRHQTKNEPVIKKRFINDTTRNDFHKKFLDRYIK